MIKKVLALTAILAGVLAYQACSGVSGEDQSPAPLGTARPFKMGFSPWPWDATQAAVDWTWDQIFADGDVVSIHTEEGVPWNEALNSQPFPANFQATLNDRKLRLQAAGRPSILSVNAMDISRTVLAPYRGAGINEPLSAPWNGYAFNHPNVKAAYLNYVKRLIDYYQPLYVLTGIEVNILRANSGPVVWSQFKELQCYVYNQLKSAGYTQPIAVSMVTPAYYHPDLYATEFDSTSQAQVMRDMEPCLDVVAWSVHPFMSGLLANSFPDDYFSIVSSMTTKPQAISESSYPAQTWSALGMTFSGSPEKQDAMIHSMLSFAEKKKFRFVLWYSVRDYDQLWARPVAQGGLGSSDLALVWRDTGLFDENGSERAGLQTWRQYLAK